MGLFFFFFIGNQYFCSIFGAYDTHG